MTLIPGIDLLHASIDMKALCDGRPLDPDRTSDSPDCRDSPICRLCWLLVEQQRKENAV